MLRKAIALLLILSTLISLTGCYTHKYMMGNGPQTGNAQEERQWFALWGLIPINTVDTKAMIGNATDYSVKSELTFLDVVIGIFTGIVTVQPRTIEVKK